MAIGMNPLFSSSMATGGMAMPLTAYPMPATPATPVAPGPAGERFVASSAGGVIVGKDGVPAGRVPAGSFIDLKDGTVYGADGKAIALPEGASVDFFDLPDLQVLRDINGGGPIAPGKTAVDGQWGPGGVTPIKGAGPASDAGGSAMQRLTSTVQDMLGKGVMAGGATSAVAGTNGLGEVPSLQASLMEMIRTLTMLTQSLSVLGGGALHRPRPVVFDRGYHPGQFTIQSPPAKSVIDVDPPKTELPKVEPPKTELPSTETASNSSSSSTSTSVAANASNT